MKRIVKYDVVCNWEAADFAKECQGMIDKGWIPRGPMLCVVSPSPYSMPNGEVCHVIKYQNFVMYETRSESKKEQQLRDIRINETTTEQEEKK